MKFRTWLEAKDIFGFDSSPEKSIEQNISKEYPVTVFDVEYTINLLMEKNLDNKQPISKFMNQVQWGYGPGAVRISVSPMNDAFIHTLMHDLEGNPVWACRKVFQINTDNFAGKERVVSEELYEQAERLNKHFLLYPKEQMDFQSFAYNFAQRLRNFKSEIFYYKGTKKINENNYNIWFEIKGQGSGRVAASTTTSSSTVLQMITDISFNPQTGMIRTMLTNIHDSEDDSTSWLLWYSDFNEQYSPMQSRDEIIETFVSYLKYY